MHFVQFPVLDFALNHYGSLPFNYISVDIHPSPSSSPAVSDFIARHGHHSQQMEDFLREAKEMAKVDHHHVVKLIAVCTL